MGVERGVYAARCVSPMQRVRDLLGRPIHSIDAAFPSSRHRFIKYGVGAFGTIGIRCIAGHDGSPPISFAGQMRLAALMSLPPNLQWPSRFAHGPTR